MRYHRAKRCFDLATAALLLALCLPLLLVLCLAIYLDSPGPVLFVQDRVGFRGRRFRMYKLRTMVRNADAWLPYLRQKHGVTGPVFKLEHDPRITRVGQWLRRWSLDELPQLWNVLLGDMSLVGPRPLPPAQIDCHDDRFCCRTRVPPGLTGLWQVNGRAMHVDYDRWLAMDCRYVEDCGLGLDLEILVKTVPAVLAGVGAW